MQRMLQVKKSVLHNKATHRHGAVLENFAATVKANSPDPRNGAVLKFFAANLIAP